MKLGAATLTHFYRVVLWHGPISPSTWTGSEELQACVHGMMLQPIFLQQLLGLVSSSKPASGLRLSKPGMARVFAGVPFPY